MVFQERTFHNKRNRTQLATGTSKSTFLQNLKIESYTLANENDATNHYALTSDSLKKVYDEFQSMMISAETPIQLIPIIIDNLNNTNNRINGLGALASRDAIETTQITDGSVTPEKLASYVTLDTILSKGNSSRRELIINKIKCIDLNAKEAMFGGGHVRVSSTGSVKWDTIRIPIYGRFRDFSERLSVGDFNIACPTSGGISLNDSTDGVTATTNGIPLAAGQGLYYKLHGVSYSPGNFKVVSYEANDPAHPWSTPSSDHILICARDPSNSVIHWFPTKQTIEFGKSINTNDGSFDVSGTITAGAFSGTVQASDVSGLAAVATGGTLSSGRITGNFNANRIDAGTLTVPIQTTSTTSRIAQLKIDSWIKHEGDDNTYVGFPSAGDTFTITTGGTERVKVDSSGLTWGGSTVVIDSSGTISSSRISGLGALASLDTVGNGEITGLAYSKLTGAPPIPSGALASLDTVGNGEITGLAYSKLTGAPPIPSGALASLDTVGNGEITGLAYSKLTGAPPIPSGALASRNTVGTAQIQDGSVTAAKLGSDVDLGGGAGGEVALATFGKSTTLTLSTSEGIAAKVVIPWETTIVQNVAVSVSGGTITINETGTYDIKVNVGWDNDGTNRASPAISLWTDASTEITRTRTFTYSRGSGYDGIAKNTLIATTLELSAGDKLYVYGWLDDIDSNYTVHTVNDSCELVFTKLSSAVSSSSFTIPNLASVAAAGGDFGNTIQWTGGNKDIIRIYRSHNNSWRTMLKQVSDNGGLQLGTDDVLILGGGEAAALLGSSVTTTEEKVHIGADGGICFYSWKSDVANSWGNRRQITMDNAGNLVFSNGYLNAKTGVRVNGTEIISSSGTIPYSKLTGTPSLAPCATGGSISGDLVDGGTVQADRFLINSTTSTLTPEYLVGETAGSGHRYEWTKVDNFGSAVSDLLTIGGLNLQEMNIRGDFVRISKDCASQEASTVINLHGKRIILGAQAVDKAEYEGGGYSDNTIYCFNNFRPLGTLSHYFRETPPDSASYPNPMPPLRVTLNYTDIDAVRNRHKLVQYYILKHRTLIKVTPNEEERAQKTTIMCNFTLNLTGGTVINPTKGDSFTYFSSTPGDDKPFFKQIELEWRINPGAVSSSLRPPLTRISIDIAVDMSDLTNLGAIQFIDNSMDFYGS